MRNDLFAKSVVVEENRSVSVVELPGGGVVITGVTTNPMPFETSDWHSREQSIRFSEEAGTALAGLLSSYAATVGQRPPRMAKEKPGPPKREDWFGLLDQPCEHLWTDWGTAMCYKGGVCFLMTYDRDSSRCPEGRKLKNDTGE